MKKYLVTDASGVTHTVEADRAVEEDNRVKFFAGDDQVASFVGASTWCQVPSDTQN